MMVISVGRCASVGARKDLACDVALEAAADFLGALAPGQTPLHVLAGGRAGAHPREDDGVDRSVEAAVTAAVEQVSHRVAQ